MRANSQTSIQQLILKGYSDYFPVDLLNNPGIVGSDFSDFIRKYPFGWGKGRDLIETLEALAKLNNTGSTLWQVYTKTQYGGLPPVIVVSGKLCDGFHRTLLCHLLGVKVRAAEFVCKSGSSES